jgi:hypothetical protein
VDRLSTVKRWMYKSGRPNSVAALLNRCWAIVAAAGFGPNRMVTLEVPGRKSGRLTSFPLMVVDYQGERYLVAMLGEGTNWVSNVRAAGGLAVLSHRRREAVRLEEVNPRICAPILRRYLQIAPGARPHIPVDRRAPLVDFQQIAVHYPVFLIRPDLLPTGDGAPLSGRLFSGPRSEEKTGEGTEPGTSDGVATGGSDWPAYLDAMVAAAAHHEVLLENECVRVLDTRLGPGETTPVHTHPWPSVLYVLTWSDFIRYDSHGKVLLDSRALPSTPEEGTTLWSGPLGPHSAKNVGDGQLRVIAVELKNSTPGFLG